MVGVYDQKQVQRGDRGNRGGTRDTGVRTAREAGSSHCIGVRAGDVHRCIERETIMLVANESRRIQRLD